MDGALTVSPVNTVNRIGQLMFTDDQITKQAELRIVII
jgi:hypothetical protein